MAKEEKSKLGANPLDRHTKEVLGGPAKGAATVEVNGLGEGRPKKPDEAVQKKRVVFINDLIFDAAQARAEREGVAISVVVRRALAEYLGLAE